MSYIRFRLELYPTISVTSHDPCVTNVDTPAVPNYNNRIKHVVITG